jgi:hypothetical protein
MVAFSIVPYVLRVFLAERTWGGDVSAAGRMGVQMPPFVGSDD